MASASQARPTLFSLPAPLSQPTSPEDRGLLSLSSRCVSPRNNGTKLDEDNRWTEGEIEREGNGECASDREGRREREQAQEQQGRELSLSRREWRAALGASRRHQTPDSRPSDAPRLSRNWPVFEFACTSRSSFEGFAYPRRPSSRPLHRRVSFPLIFHLAIYRLPTTGRTTSSPKPTRHNAVSVRSFFLHSSRLAFLLSLRCVVSVPLCGSWPRVAHRERHSSHVDRAELSFSRPRSRNRSLPVNDTSPVIVSFSDVSYAIRWMSPFEQPFASYLENWQTERTRRCLSIERLV